MVKFGANRMKKQRRLGAISWEKKVEEPNQENRTSTALEPHWNRTGTARRESQRHTADQQSAPRKSGSEPDRNRCSREERRRNAA